MIIDEIKGNLVTLFLNGKYHIGHGCNCFCAMGAGIAKEIRERIPKLYEYDLLTEKGSREKLGTTTYILNDNVLAFNMYTQYQFWGASELVDYDAVGDAVATAVKIIDGYIDANILTARLPLALPLIGAGLAGGDWTRIKQIIDERSGNYPVVIVHFDGSK